MGAVVLGTPLTAWAGFDGSGPPLPVTSDDVAVPLIAWRAARPLRGAFSAGGVVALVAEPLLRFEVDPLTGEDTEVPVIGGLLGVRLGARYAVTDRVEVAVSAPAWIGAEGEEAFPGPGDVSVSVPIGLWQAGQARTGSAAVAVVPAVSLPTGAERAYLGDPWPSVAVRGVAEAAYGPVLAVGWAGLDLRGFPADQNYLPGPGAHGGVAAGVALDRRFGVHAGWRTAVRLRGPEIPPDVLAPARVTASEVAVSARGALFDRWYLEGGVAGATQRGPGAATARTWLGFGKSLGGVPPAPLAPAVERVVEVRAPDGTAVSGATVDLGEQRLGTTGPDGTLTLRRRWRPADVLRVDADGLQPATATDLVPATDAPVDAPMEPVRLVLAWDPVPVTATVQDAEGRALAARLTAASPDGEVVPATPDGRLELAPGAWTVRAAVDGYGAQERGLDLQPRSAGEELLFILRPVAGESALEVAVVDVDGQPVEGAGISLGGRPVGRTGSGGGLRIEGLSGDPVELDAQADTFRELTRPGVVPGDEPVQVVLARERGAVQLVVRGPDGGPVPDAAARFIGPDRLGPFEIGEDGERTFVLRPGPWQALISSPSSGLQQRALDIPERDAALQVVEVVLQPPEDGTTDLTVRVVDADNQPVPGASITLDGVDYGATSSGGELVLEDLREGPRQIVVGGRWLQPATSEVFLAGGLQEHTVLASWKEGTTRILARGPQGMVEDATARFFGPSPRDPIPLGADGVATLGLDTGDWQVLVSSPRLGFQQLGVAIPEGSRTLHVVEAVLNPGEAGVGRLSLEVVDPDGQPISGVEIALDDIPLGATSTSGTVSLVELATGTRRVTLSRPPFQTRNVDVTVTAAETERRVTLPWGTGAVRVALSSDEGPIRDGRLRLGGPRFVPATPVDDAGRRLLTLEPGTWQLLASSPAFAPAQRTFTVPPEPGLTELDVRLAPPTARLAEVLVRVQDPDQEPVAGASILVDADAPVQTGDGGLAVLQLEPGAHRLQVRADDFEPVTFEALDVRAGVSERILPLRWVPRELDVRVSGPDGPLAGARVRLDGPVEVAPVTTDAEGGAALRVRPGAWSVLASAPELGVQEASVQVAPGAPPRTVELVLQPAQVEVSGADITIRNTLYFDTGRATLKPRSTPILDEVAATLKAHPELVRLDVEGHTDPTGGVAFNMRLSRERAQAVVDALIERGVAPERLRAQGYGPTRPVADNDSESGRARNRRVELHGEVDEAFVDGE